MTPHPPAWFVEERPTPIGTLLLVTDGDGCVRALDWDDDRPRLARLLARHAGGTPRRADAGRALAALAPRPRASAAADALAAYFDGDLGAIDRVQVASIGTPFQRDVWAALRRIPVGRTISYAALAAAIGRPRATRAVGLANGANPVGIIVPCHRVIGADASLTGYGGGLARKRWLLEHEGAISPRLPVLPAAAGSWA